MILRILILFLQINRSTQNKPKIIFANTIKGKGVTSLEGRFESHYKSLDEVSIKEILLNL